MPLIIVVTPDAMVSKAAALKAGNCISCLERLRGYFSLVPHTAFMPLFVWPCRLAQPLSCGKLSSL